MDQVIIPIFNFEYFIVINQKYMGVSRVIVIRLISTDSYILSECSETYKKECANGKVLGRDKMV